jgi:hypothetical protein
MILAIATLPQTDPDVVAAADRAARHWVSDDPAPRWRRGSDVQKRAARAMFDDTFNPYKPSVIAWPVLDDERRLRITALPIWDIAVQTEGKARLRMLSYSDRVVDADWKHALARNGWEEGRHKEVLHNMVAFYGIALEPEPPYLEPRDPEWAYLVTGFSECIDSFFAFGLFEVARRSGLFPPELIDTFEPVMQEECRHILLFANWLAWHRRQLSLPARILFELRVAACWVFLGYERVNLSRGLGGEDEPKVQDNNFTVTGAKSVTDVEISVPELMGLCLEQNDLRFRGYDARLLRPTTMPALTRAALGAMGAWRGLRSGLARSRGAGRARRIRRAVARASA